MTQEPLLIRNSNKVPNFELKIFAPFLYKNCGICENLLEATGFVVFTICLINIMITHLVRSNTSTIITHIMYISYLNFRLDFL